MTPQEIRQMDSLAVKGRFHELSAKFREISQELTVVAKEIEAMKANCRHQNSEARPYARWCNDCNEYYKVNTSFSPETESWFAEQNRQANLPKSS